MFGKFYSKINFILHFSSLSSLSHTQEETKNTPNSSGESIGISNDYSANEDAKKESDKDAFAEFKFGEDAEFYEGLFEEIKGKLSKQCSKKNSPSSI